MECSMDYMTQALKINNALSEQFKEDVAKSQKQRKKAEEGVEKMIKNQGDILEAGIRYIILCGAKELEFSRQWGGS